MGLAAFGKDCWYHIGNNIYDFSKMNQAEIDKISGMSSLEQQQYVESNCVRVVSKSELLSAGVSEDTLQTFSLEFDDDIDEENDTKTDTDKNDVNGASQGLKKQNDVDYKNWLVNNGLSGASKLSAESKIEDVQKYYNHIADNLSSIMASIDGAIASKDPDTIDSYMTELTYNMAALEGVSRQSGMGSIMSQDMAWGGMFGGAAVAGAATMFGATGTLATVAGVSVTVPVIGWAVAGVCAAAAIGIGIYNSVKQGEIDDLKEQMQQTMDDCTAKLEYAQKEIGEIVEDEVSAIENDIKRLEKADFDDINDMNDMFTNINGIQVFQASIEKWAALCEKYDIPFEGADLLDKLGNEDDKNKYANEYVEKFVEHTKNAIESSGNVVDDTGSYIASADEINALISMLYDNEMTRNVDIAPLKELINFIKEKNQEEVNNDTENLSDGLSSGGQYDFGEYSNIYNSAGETQTGVNGAATDGQYDLDTSKYEDVQKEAQETAQKDVDEYLSNIDPKGKTVEELEELYEATNKDFEDFSQYKDNLDLDLSKFDTILADIRKEQQARVDEYIDSISVSGKSMSELDELYDEVSKQGEAFKQASSDVDTNAFRDVLASIREEQQAIADDYLYEVSSRIENAGSVNELATISAEIAQYKDGVSLYNVDTGQLSAISTRVRDKIQAIINEKSANYEIQASMVQTSSDALTLADIINTEIAQLQNPEINTSSLQKIVSDLISKANKLRIGEARKQAEEDAMNVPAAKPDTLTDSGSFGSYAESDGEHIPVVIPAFAGDGAPAYDPEAAGGDGEIPADSETPVAGEEGEAVQNPEGEGGEEGVPPAAAEGETPLEEAETPAVTPSAVPSVPPAITESVEGSMETEIPPVASETPAEPTQTEAADSNNTIISVGQADENTPPPADTENLEQTAKEAVAESKTPEEIADLIEIEIQE